MMISLNNFILSKHMTKFNIINAGLGNKLGLYKPSPAGYTIANHGRCNIIKVIIHSNLNSLLTKEFWRAREREVLYVIYSKMAVKILYMREHFYIIAVLIQSDL